jgi:hypothetical protein
LAILEVPFPALQTWPVVVNVAVADTEDL